MSEALNSSAQMFPLEVGTRHRTLGLRAVQVEGPQPAVLTGEATVYTCCSGLWSSEVLLRTEGWTALAMEGAPRPEVASAGLAAVHLWNRGPEGLLQGSLPPTPLLHSLCLQ